MNIMVALRTLWFSCNLSLSWPYKSKWTNILSSKNGRLFAKIIGLRVWKSSRLWSIKFGQWSRKWVDVSALVEQGHNSLGVSWKLWFILWLLRGLSPTLSWNNHLLTVGSWILNTLFFWLDGIFLKASFWKLIVIRILEVEDLGRSTWWRCLERNCSDIYQFDKIYLYWHI